MESDKRSMDDREDARGLKYINYMPDLKKGEI